MVNILNIIQIFQCVQQLLHLGRTFLIQIHGIFGAHRHLGHLGLEARCLQRIAHRFTF